jgi:integrase/recombinase XerD
LPEPAEVITKPAEVNQAILDFLLDQRKAGRTDETIKSRIQTLNQVAKATNLKDPEKVKEYLAKSQWNNRTKNKFIDTYTAFLSYLGLKWKPPQYQVAERLPFIPTEQEIDLLISGTGKVTSAVLQTLKETGIRIGELTQLKWKDLDIERKTLSITPEKGSNPRILPITDKLIGMLNSQPKNKPTIFQPDARYLRGYLATQRKKLAQKLNNPRLKEISFHTLRHWKGTMEYHKTQSIMHVKQILGHKSITSTMIYINLEQAIFLNGTDEWTTATAKTPEECCKLIDVGFTLADTIDGIHIYRKRK